MTNPFQKFDDTLGERREKVLADFDRLGILSLKKFFRKETNRRLPNPFYLFELSLKNYLSQAVNILVDCAMVSCQKKPENLAEPSRLALYHRFLQELVDLDKISYLPRLFAQVPSLEDLLKEASHSLPAPLIRSEAHLGLLKSTVFHLQKHKYLTRRAASLLFNLISPYHAPERLDSPTPLPVSKEEERTEAPSVLESMVSKSAVPSVAEENPALARDYLIRLGLDEDTAEKYSSLGLFALKQTFYSLEALLGEDPARNLLCSHPDIFTYPSKNQLNKYFKSLKTLSEKSPLSSYPLEEYSSLEKALALKSRLFPNGDSLENKEPCSEESRKISLDKKSLANYTFLHNNNPYVIKRLNDLLTAGKTAVTDHEHWGGESSGARGARILKKIRHQMRGLYAELSLSELQCQINFSQQTLEISQSDRRILSEIVESIKDY